MAPTKPRKARPALAKGLDAVRDTPIRKLIVSFEPSQLPRGQVLVLGLTSERLFSQPMRFLFAHYRHAPDVRTWMAWMLLEEPDPAQVRPDGKRVVGRFEWFKQVGPLAEQLDGTELRDLPATFELALDALLPQTMEVPSLSALVSAGAEFRLTLVGEDRAAEQVIATDETALDLRVTASYASGLEVTLFRSNHRPIEREVLRGLFLAGKESAKESAKQSAIAREAILSQDPRLHELVAAERRQRGTHARGLLDKDEGTLSPEERRVVATLRQGDAQLLMSRVFGNTPPPGPERKELQASAVAACEMVVRLLAPLVAVDARYHDVGRAYWAASSLAHYYEVTRASAAARRYAQLAVDLVEQAIAQLPDESEFAAWLRSARERLTGARPGSSAPATAGRKSE